MVSVPVVYLPSLTVIQIIVYKVLSGVKRGYAKIPDVTIEAPEVVVFLERRMGVCETAKEPAHVVVAHGEEVVILFGDGETGFAIR